MPGRPGQRDILTRGNYTNGGQQGVWAEWMGSDGLTNQALMVDRAKSGGFWEGVRVEKTQPTTEFEKPETFACLAGGP